MDLCRCKACGAANPVSLDDPRPESCSSCGSDLRTGITVASRDFTPIRRETEKVQARLEREIMRDGRIRLDPERKTFIPDRKSVTKDRHRVGQTRRNARRRA